MEWLLGISNDEGDKEHNTIKQGGRGEAGRGEGSVPITVRAFLQPLGTFC